MVSGREQLVLGDTINPTAQPGENGEPAPKPVSSSVGQVVIGRTDTPDISSGRFDSLGKAFQLFIKDPILGIGQGNIVEYGERYLDEGFLFEDLHNGYVTILVSYGIVGFLLVMAFLFVLARRMYAGLRKNLHKDKPQLPLLFAMLGGYCVYSLFDITLLLDVNFMVVIFWLLLGYATTYMLQYETRFGVVTSQPFSVWKQKTPVRVPLYLLPTGRSYSSLRLMTEEMCIRDRQVQRLPRFLDPNRAEGLLWENREGSFDIGKERAEGREKNKISETGFLPKHTGPRLHPYRKCHLETDKGALALSLIHIWFRMWILL